MAARKRPQYEEYGTLGIKRPRYSVIQEHGRYELLYEDSSLAKVSHYAVNYAIHGDREGRPADSVIIFDNWTEGSIRVKHL